jgi:hypothetical protein
MAGSVLFADETKTGVYTRGIGLTFQVQGLSVLLDNVNNGGMEYAGLGMRFRPIEELVLRTIVYIKFNYNTVTYLADFRTGLSVGGEYHFTKGVVSPYLGIIGGMEFSTSILGAGLDWHVGAMFGVELMPLEFLSIFVEYTLVTTFRETGVDLELGYNHLPTFGVHIYLN